MRARDHPATEIDALLPRSAVEGRRSMQSRCTASGARVVCHTGQKHGNRCRIGNGANRCRRLEDAVANCAWSVLTATCHRRSLKWKAVKDERTRERHHSRVRPINGMASPHVMHVLDRLMSERGEPAFSRSFIGPKFFADLVRRPVSDLVVECWLL